MLDFLEGGYQQGSFGGFSAIFFVFASFTAGLWRVALTTDKHRSPSTND